MGKSGFHGAFVLIGGSFAARSPASAALAAFEDFRVELNKGLSDAWDSYYDGSVQMTRTVNGTGHTGPSEFCATSI